METGSPAANRFLTHSAIYSSELNEGVIKVRKGNSTLTDAKSSTWGIGIIGTGAVGCALAKGLTQAGHTLTALVDKKPAVARELAAELKLDHYAPTLDQIGPDTQILIVSVPDSQIPIVDHSIAKRLPKIRIKACVHTSGALPGSSLSAVSAGGVRVASLHPLQTFASREKSPGLKNVFFAIEGDPAILERLEELVRQMGGIPVVIPSDGKALYHAAAVFASNFIPTLLRVSTELLDSIGVSPEDSRKMLAPLMQQTIENCLRIGEISALTGPVARGDAQTIARHLDAIGKVNLPLQAIYRILSLKTLELAQEKGLEEVEFNSILEILQGSVTDSA